MAGAYKPGSVFVKRKHELADVLKLVEDLSVTSLTLIKEALADENETKKTKLALAEKVLDLHIRLADTISKDEFARQIAEVKAVGLTPQLEPDKKPSGPRLDMTTIQKV